MKPLKKAVAAHPLADKTPYNAIKFSRVDGFGTPLYKVGRGKGEMGAETALRTAFRRYGGHCFLCNEWMTNEDKEVFSLDHVRPKKDNGTADLHNLVFACRNCNLDKGCKDMAEYKPEVTSAYLKALDAHLVRCLKALGSE
jgi:hypothetical protein